MPDNLKLFTTVKTQKEELDKTNAAIWFNQIPPDMTHVTRSIWTGSLRIT
jgi:hypothetical protein